MKDLVLTADRDPRADYRLSDFEKASAVAAPWSSDSHIPMFWCGVSIEQETYYSFVSVADICTDTFGDT